jgi:hypothetical protein
MVPTLPQRRPVDAAPLRGLGFEKHFGSGHGRGTWRQRPAGSPKSHNAIKKTGYWLTDTQFFQARFSRPKKIRQPYQRLLAYGPAARRPSRSPLTRGSPVALAVHGGLSQSQLRTSGGCAPPSVEVCWSNYTPLGKLLSSEFFNSEFFNEFFKGKNKRLILLGA